MTDELAKQISFRISLLKTEKQVSWDVIAEGLGYNNTQTLRNRMSRGNWPVDSLMDIADYFKVPLLYFLVPEDRVDEIMGRKEAVKDDETAYELHQAVIKLGKAEAEIRGKDKRIEELENELKEKDKVITDYKVKALVVAPNNVISEISAQQLKLSVKLVQAVAEIMEGGNGLQVC